VAKQQRQQPDQPSPHKFVRYGLKVTPFGGFIHGMVACACSHAAVDGSHFSLFQAATSTTAKSEITLRGSVQVVAEFFGFAINRYKRKLLFAMLPLVLSAYRPAVFCISVEFIHLNRLRLLASTAFG
jgi:hypothetical protein